MQPMIQAVIIVSYTMHAAAIHVVGAYGKLYSPWPWTAQMVELRTKHTDRHSTNMLAWLAIQLSYFAESCLRLGTHRHL